MDDRDGSFVGVARYIQRADRPPAADMAITVADRHQNMGVGAALGARILERAQTNGFDALTATTLRENPPARAVLRRLGFAPRSSNGREIELERELTVEPTGAVTIRVGTADDLPALRRLAALDSARVPALPVLIAEVDGAPRAALSLGDGATVADPFHLTESLVRMLATRAEQLPGRRARRHLDIWSGVLDPVPGTG